MSARYSGTPLVRKLGLKPGMRVRLLEAPDGYWDLLGGPPAALEVTLLPSDADAAAAADAAADGAPADFTHLF
ncbi:MAG: hypothetical protein ACOC8B_06685, partial [Gemmatimonadota bacterium]